MNMDVTMIRDGRGLVRVVFQKSPAWVVLSPDNVKRLGEILERENRLQEIHPTSTRLGFCCSKLQVFSYDSREVPGHADIMDAKCETCRTELFKVRSDTSYVYVAGSVDAEDAPEKHVPPSNELYAIAFERLCTGWKMPNKYKVRLRRDLGTALGKVPVRLLPDFSPPKFEGEESYYETSRGERVFNRIAFANAGGVCHKVADTRQITVGIGWDLVAGIDVDAEPPGRRGRWPWD